MPIGEGIERSKAAPVKFGHIALFVQATCNKGDRTNTILKASILHRLPLFIRGMIDRLFLPLRPVSHQHGEQQGP